MYGKSLAAAGVPATTLAFTGPTQPLWLTIAGVGLLGAGAAVLRFVPKAQK